MDHEERIMAVFEDRPRDKVPFNIRPEYWYNVAKISHRLPTKYEGMDIPDVCREWGASWRCYSGYFVEPFVEATYSQDVEFKTEKTGDLFRNTTNTPVGSIHEVIKYDEWGLSARKLEYPLKTPEDFKVLSYVLDSVKIRFNEQTYERVKVGVKGQGFVSFFFPRSPLQNLLLEYLGITRTLRYLYMDRGPELESLMEAIERHNDKFYEVMVHTPIEVFNLGENNDVRLTSPSLFKRYCLPIYQKRCDYLHRFGKYVHMHVDGHAKPLLPLLKESGLDGIEAITPKPVGDMTLRDIREGLGDEMVILDGIPYLMFLSDFPLATLEDFVREIVVTFPRLILGISDELPPPGDPERVIRVSRLLDKLTSNRPS